MQTFFISHGAPDIILSENPALMALRSLSAGLPRPDAIIIVSAHWIDDPVGITTGEQLNTIHDFGGFPEALYTMQYPARGDDELSRDIARRLQQQGIHYRFHSQRGLDHGAWIPLLIMYPEADIPVVQVSLPAGSLHELAKLGNALSPLRHENVLMIGSGGSVHNLRTLNFTDQTDAWVVEFEDWLRNAVEGNHFDKLITPDTFPENFRRAHPTIEHYAPLIFAWAAADTAQGGKRIHHSVSYGNLGMSAFAFG